MLLHSLSYIVGEGKFSLFSLYRTTDQICGKSVARKVWRAGYPADPYNICMQTKQMKQLNRRNELYEKYIAGILPY